MSQQTERRKADRTADEELSPEYLALLEICGGEIRESDRAALAKRRAATQGAVSADGPAPDVKPLP
jgi:hypothetical protein